MDAVVDRFGRFARDEADGRSAVYAAWAHRVAADRSVAAVIAGIRPQRRQPPLVFAVARVLGLSDAADADEFAGWVLANGDALRRESEARALQTNEPQRCAVLLAALARIDGPIALLEVGASAGLCLYPDRYSYRYTVGDQVVRALDPAAGVSEVVLTCPVRGAEADADALIPTHLPDVVWRAGIDLHPLDPGAESTRQWLTALVWPGEEGRAERMQAALRIAASDPAPLHAGDAAEVLAAVAATAPTDATLVVTTPGVLVHIARESRERVIGAARDAGRWVTLDPPGLHLTERGSAPGTWRAEELVGWREGFALALDGEIVAVADPLGRWMERLPATNGARG